MLPFIGARPGGQSRQTVTTILSNPMLDRARRDTMLAGNGRERHLLLQKRLKQGETFKSLNALLL